MDTNHRRREPEELNDLDKEIWSAVTFDGVPFHKGTYKEVDEAVKELVASGKVSGKEITITTSEAADRFLESLKSKEAQDDKQD